MDSFFDSLKRKMSKRYNKGEQPHPAPRPVYNTRKAEREWRERQVDLSREALEHREAVLNELRGETSRNSYGGARPKNVSMDPKDLFRGQNPVQEEAPPSSLPAVDLNHFPGLVRRNESGPILTKRQNYAADKEVMIMGQREREANQNQISADYGGQVTIEDCPEDGDIV